MSSGTQAGPAISWPGPLRPGTGSHSPAISTEEISSASLLRRDSCASPIPQADCPGRVPRLAPHHTQLGALLVQAGHPLATLLKHHLVWGIGWALGNSQLDGGPEEVPTHAWPRCIPGGSRMDGGWSSSERTKFTCLEGASLHWWRLGAGPRGRITYRSVSVHSSRMEYLGPWCSTRARGYPGPGSGKSSPPDAREGQRWV